MNEFEKWYEEFTGVSIGYAEKRGMNSDVLKAAYAAGMVEAAAIITRECCRDESGCCCNETTQIIKNESGAL